MQLFGASFLDAVNRMAKLRVYGVITPKRGQTKPIVLSNDGTVPQVLDGLRLNSDTPHDWRIFYKGSGAIQVYPTFIHAGTGGGDARANIETGWRPNIHHVILINSGAILAKIRFTTSNQVAGLGVSWSNWYTSGQMPLFQCLAWLGIQIWIPPNSNLTTLEIIYGSQVISGAVTGYGELVKQLLDNSVAYASASVKLSNIDWQPEKMTVLGEDIGLVLSAKSRNSRDYIALWQGQISEVAGDTVSGDLAREYLTQNYPRFKTADGKRWPTPFGDFTEPARVVVDEPQLAQYDDGARVAVSGIEPKDDIRDLDITAMWVDGAWMFSASDVKKGLLVYEDFVIKEKKDEDDDNPKEICQVALQPFITDNISSGIQNGDTVQISCRKGGRCPAVKLHDADRFGVYALAQWPIGSVTSMWQGGEELPAGTYTVQIGKDYAGKKNISYAVVQRTGIVRGDPSYHGSAGDRQEELEFIDRLFIQDAGDEASPSSDWTGRVKIEITDIEESPDKVKATIYRYHEDDEEWIDFEDEKSTVIYIDKDVEYNLCGISFKFPGGKLHDKRATGDAWTFSIERLEGAVTWCGTGLRGVTTLPDIITALTEWSPGWDFYLTRPILDEGSVSRLPRLAIAGMLPDSVDTLGAAYAELLQNIADVDATRGAVRFVLQKRYDAGGLSQIGDSAAIEYKANNCYRKGVFIGESLNGIQNDIVLETGGAFGIDPRYTIRRISIPSIAKYSRIDGHGATRRESVRYPYAVNRAAAEKICADRLEYKKNIVRMFRIFPETPLAALHELGDIVRISDPWLPNFTYGESGLSKQPARIEGVTVDMDTMKVELLVTITGAMLPPDTDWHIPDTPDPEDGVLIWDEGAWDDKYWGKE